MTTVKIKSKNLVHPFLTNLSFSADSTCIFCKANLVKWPLVDQEDFASHQKEMKTL